MSNKTNNWLLFLGVIALAVAPLLFVKGEYTGSDDKAKEAITELHPQYKPWFQPVFELPSSEVASLLFSVQAAGGAGVIGYVIGLYKGRTESKQRNENTDRHTGIHK
ncbi:MAG: energy-coupling factor ABC transporter substrate-binding protein [Calothrix sp. FI2-JRJ7]|jgi:cobalt/nickel transport protein|nr:energy-coupling factor ABC transporter substrate-binding protein [Calothrix sp. FI2-JRJ7]